MERLDVYLSKLDEFTSRTQAQDRIKEGLVKVNDKVVKKASLLIDENDCVKYETQEKEFASRGGLKLYGALESFKIDLKGRTVLDIGASTGGFSDVCLQAGASYIYAIDSGSGQLIERLKKDPRLKNMENINARYLNSDLFDKKIDFVCMDVSFISIRLICDSLFPILQNPYECVFLIKPQFEAGKSFIGKNGIVKDRKVHKRILDEYIQYFNEQHLAILHLGKSQITGKDGNQEYLIHLSSEGKSRMFDTSKIVKEREK